MSRQHTQELLEECKLGKTDGGGIPGDRDSPSAAHCILGQHE